LGLVETTDLNGKVGLEVSLLPAAAKAPEPNNTPTPPMKQGIPAGSQTASNALNSSEAAAVNIEPSPSASPAAAMPDTTSTPVGLRMSTITDATGKVVFLVSGDGSNKIQVAEGEVGSAADALNKAVGEYDQAKRQGAPDVDTKKATMEQKQKAFNKASAN